MTLLTAIAALLIPVALYVGWSSRQRRLEHQLRRLRNDVVSYRAAHESLTASLDRRLAALEQTTALAANELRMASALLMDERSPASPQVGEPG